MTFIYITHDQGEALAMSDRVGVMSQGKLQQVATPREIYNNPANGFVASFVGENNILAGRSARPRTTWPLCDRKRHLRGPHGPAASPGATRKLYLRPEHDRCKPRPGPKTRSPVEVTDVAFEGNFITIHGRDATRQLLVAEARNDGSATIPATGAKTHMAFDAAHAAILPDSAGARALSE